MKFGIAVLSIQVETITSVIAADFVGFFCIVFNPHRRARKLLPAECVVGSVNHGRPPDKNVFVCFLHPCQ